MYLWDSFVSSVTLLCLWFFEGDSDAFDDVRFQLSWDLGFIDYSEFCEKSLFWSDLFFFILKVSILQIVIYICFFLFLFQFFLEIFLIFKICKNGKMRNFFFGIFVFPFFQQKHAKLTFNAFYYVIAFKKFGLLFNWELIILVFKWFGFLSMALNLFLLSLNGLIWVSEKGNLGKKQTPNKAIRRNV